MRETQEIVINTSPIIAIVAATGDLRILQMYERVWVPHEVVEELSAGGRDAFALREFVNAHWIRKSTQPLAISPVLLNTLDRGEAAVIQLALNEALETACIDDTAGRRMARLNGLSVTGSIGVLLRAKRTGYQFSMRHAIERMRKRGIWLSDRVVAFALSEVGEDGDD